MAVAALLPLVAGCGSKQQDSLVGKNVDLNAIVATNSDEANAAANDVTSTQTATAQSNSTWQQPGTANVSAPAPAPRRSTGRTHVAGNGSGDATVSNDTALNQTQDDTTEPSNLE